LPFVSAILLWYRCFRCYAKIFTSKTAKTPYWWGFSHISKKSNGEATPSKELGGPPNDTHTQNKFLFCVGFRIDFQGVMFRVLIFIMVFCGFYVEKGLFIIIKN